MKKLKPYLFTSLIVLLVLTTIFIFKGIFPFGNNSLIWGDMHDQITAFYYHLYDSVYGNKSLFIDFTTSGGINFLGILAYYILSPFSLLILLVPRDSIYLMVSVIIACKMVMCSITCLCFLRTYFKNLPSLLSILLAIIYAFSGYALAMYQITPWIDAMYMFPLIMIGLKKLLDLEKPTFYIITLTLSLIFSFYVTVMTIIFIFLVSFIYLYVYKEKEDRKKAIVSLGIATVLSLGISLFIVIPSYMQISESSRLSFKLKTLLNSKMGPLSDKLSFIAFGGVVYAGLILLFKNYKENKQFLKFYIPTLLTVLIPLIVEPINKVWHFGSYASFPYRFGYIIVFLMILGAGYSFNKYKEKKTVTLEINHLASLITVALVSFMIVKFSIRYYERFQSAIYRLSISFDNKLILVLLLTTFLAFIASLLVLLLNKNLSKFTIVLLFIISIVHITTNSYMYLGNDSHQKELTSEYRLLNKISKDYEKDNYYRVKSYLTNMLTNNGMVMKYNNLDHFTSLTNKNTLDSLKKLGYGSQWVKIYSRGSNLFIDSIMGNKYILTDSKLNNSYYKSIDSYNGNRLYEIKNNIPFGVIVSKNDTILDKNNSFEIANSLYKNIMNTDDNIFEIDDKISLENIKASTLENGLVEYSEVDEDYPVYFEKDVIIEGRKILYLEVNHFNDNNQNFRINEAFNLYINGSLYKENAFTEPENGTMYLGIYDNERVNIRLELKKSVILKEIVVGIMDTNKYDNYINNVTTVNSFKYNRNKITAQVNGEKGKYLLLPISYDKGYTATVNGHKTDVVKLYDNFIGIKLEDGVNNIKIKYIPSAFIPTLIISLAFIIITVVILKFNLIEKLINIKVIAEGSYYLYLFLYIVFTVVFYILLGLCFIISYLTYINI